jgi:transcriptional regulator with XRE-family HTH domain
MENRVPNLGRSLAILRISRGWSQLAFGARAGIHGSAISNYEQGKTVPEYATIVRLLAALGYPESALDRTRQFLAALEGEEWGPAPEGAPPDAVQLARQAGRAAEHLVLTFLEMQAGGWRSRADPKS